MVNTKKKLLILIPRMGGGGAERVVSIIANNLCRRYEIQITTLVSDESFYDLDPIVTLKSACYDIDRSSKLARHKSLAKNFVSSVFYVRKTIKEYKPDIVFPMLEEMDIVAFLATRGLKGFKVVNSERNDPHRKNPVVKCILKRIYKTGDMLVCQSKAVADYYSKVCRKIVIPNPVDLGVYPERVPEGTKTKIVGVGRLRDQKNFLMLEKAFALIADRFPDVTVTIYGEGPEREILESEARKDGLEERIFLPGESKDILNEIKDAAVFAFPTNYEGFPNALVEAIAMGIPVVTTDFATGIAREIVNEDVGIVVPVGDTKGFADALSTLLNDKERRSRIRMHSREAVAPYAVDKVIAEWNKLFMQVM